MHSIEKVDDFYEFDILWGFGQTTPELRIKLVRFWLENGAIADPYMAWRRTFEVGCVVLNREGEIVGVNSFYADRMMTDGRFYWFYRTYIRPDSRMNGLTPFIFHITYDKLSKLYAGEIGSPVGIVLIIENPKLDQRAGLRIMQRGGLEHLGADQQGKSVWRKCFPDIILPSNP
jgi:hypothetical protein